VLVLDQTILRLFPPLRSAWSRKGQQAEVRISGENAKTVLWGVLNPYTGHRLVQVSPSMGQSYFWALLKLLRSNYRGRPIALLLDKASAHRTPASQKVAAQLGIHLLWLPTQAPELNPMDQLWRDFKREVSANRQYLDIAAHVDAGLNWVLHLSPGEILRKAGALSPGFWLRKK
jgi:transposase